MHGLLWLVAISISIKLLLILGCIVNKGIRTRCWIIAMYSTAVVLMVTAIILAAPLWIATGGNVLWRLMFRIGYYADRLLDNYTQGKSLATLA